MSGYHSWQRRLPSGRQQQDLLLTRRIHIIHQRRKQRYGAPRIHADLQADGQRVSRKRVACLMRAAGLRAKGTRKFVKTTDSEHADPVSPNLLARQLRKTGARPETPWYSCAHGTKAPHRSDDVPSSRRSPPGEATDVYRAEFFRRG